MLRSRSVDVLLALAFVVAGQVEMRVPTSDGYTGGGSADNTIVLLLGGLVLGLWRVAPRAALLSMTAIFTVSSLIGPHDEFFWSSQLPLTLVTYQVARHRDGWLASWGWLAATVACYSDALHVHGLRDPTNLATSVLVFGGATVIGRLLRHQQLQRDRLDATLAEVAAEQARRERLAAQAERNRIAAETHDVVAHAVTEMVLQLGAARMGLQAHDVPVPEQLIAAEATGRTALTELRHSLGLLAEHPEKELAPVPGLADLGGLVSRFREAGLDVRMEPPDPALARLPAGLQLSVHRVLQEALTNARKHAGPVRVDVHLERRAGAVVLDVVDAGGRAPAALPSGRHGLIGMRERVAVYDGTLEAGPDHAAGWRVHARWPVEVAA